MQYLLVENPGICPSECFTILGASLSNTSNVPGIISLFGSGCKHSLALLLRHDLKPIIYVGTLCMEFDKKVQRIEDDLTYKDVERIIVKYSGKDSSGKTRNSTEELGFVVEYGNRDWDHVALALREFVSNAIDYSIRSTGLWETVGIKVVEENQVRAAKDTTRVFIPLSPTVRSFYVNLDKWFLHFSEQNMLDQTILEKKNRNLIEGNSGAVIYRRGVYVREFKETPSVFDYNINDLEIDEARKADDWHCRYAVANLLKAAPKEKLAKLFNELRRDGKVWEGTLDSYYLDTASASTEEKSTWKEAFTETFGDKAVVVSEDTLAYSYDRAVAKGFQPVKMPSAWAEAARKSGVKDTLEVLTHHEQKGLELLPPNAGVLTALDFCWGVLDAVGLTQGKNKPEVKLYRKVLDAGESSKGYYLNGIVHINEIYCPDVFCSSMLSDDVVATMFEELAHYITNATDMSRDFQDYVLQLATKLARRNQGAA